MPWPSFPVWLLLLHSISHLPARLIFVTHILDLSIKVISVGFLLYLEWNLIVLKWPTEPCTNWFVPTFPSNPVLHSIPCSIHHISLLFNWGILQINPWFRTITQAALSIESSCLVHSQTDFFTSSKAQLKCYLFRDCLCQPFLKEVDSLHFWLITIC